MKRNIIISVIIGILATFQLGNTYKLAYFNNVPAESDLNNIIAPGTYGQGMVSIFETIKNLPYSNWPYEFKLIVEYFFCDNSIYNAKIISL